MPDYRMAKPEVGKLIQALIRECDELADYVEHPPNVAVVEVLYRDDETFDKAIRKRVGAKPVRMVQVADHALRLLTSEDGLARSGSGLDFIVKLDPAAWDPLPEEARKAFLFDALITFHVEREEDKETGDQVVKMDGDHARWNARSTKENHPETFARFGPWSQYTQAILDALKAREDQKLPLFAWAGKDSLAAIRGQEEPEKGDTGLRDVARDPFEEFEESDTEPATA